MASMREKTLYIQMEHGDAKIKSLQSDGYNVYMYLDNELMDIEHLCCLAHARAKFKYAYDQGLFYSIL